MRRRRALPLGESGPEDAKRRPRCPIIRTPGDRGFDQLTLSAMLTAAALLLLTAAAGGVLLLLTGRVLASVWPLASLTPR